MAAQLVRPLSTPLPRTPLLTYDPKRNSAAPNRLPKPKKEQRKRTAMTQRFTKADLPSGKGETRQTHRAFIQPNLDIAAATAWQGYQAEGRQREQAGLIVVDEVAWKILLRGSQPVKQKSFSPRETALIFLFSILVSVFIAFGCSDPEGIAGGPYSLDDKKLLPFAAMYKVDREQFCLTEIDQDSRVEIERDSRRSHGYDVMLHLSSNGVTRTIAFVLEDDQYVWIGEQEAHYSGRKYMTPDGELREYIAITYHERKYGAGGMVGQRITYSGDDESIPRELTCEQASPYIRAWVTKEKVPDNE